MRYGFTLLVALLIATPAAAQSTGGAAIPVNITFTGSIAMGSFVCTSAGCTFMGTQLLERNTQFTFTSRTLTNPARGSFTGVFPTYGAWVSAVARWAERKLSPERRNRVVQAAARARDEVQNEGPPEARPARGKGGKETEQGEKERGRRK